jgi:hypothetical protein
MLAARRLPVGPSDVGSPRTSLAEMPSMLSDTDMGMFVLDREGVVRYAYAGAYADMHGIRKIPGVDELLRPLQAAPTG